jgi:hypothetical protein
MSHPFHRITASPHHRITASPHHRITASPHHRITASPHHRIDRRSVILNDDSADRRASTSVLTRSPKSEGPSWST